MLFEIGTRKTCTAADLIAVLGLDPGYLSRILREFSESSLVTRKQSPDDGRRTNLSLTRKGQKAFTELEQRFRRCIGALIDLLSAPQRARLVNSMRVLQETLSAAPSNQEPTVTIRPYRVGDVGWAIERHGQLYADEYGWNEEFEALVAKLFAKFATQHDSAAEQFWVAEVDGQRGGCVFVVRSEKDASAAQLRCLLVDLKARGFGIGRRLVNECIRFSKSAGYCRIVLWTNDILVSARRIYEAAGFSLIELAPHRSFGHELVGQYWARDL